MKKQYITLTIFDFDSEILITDAENEKEALNNLEKFNKKQYPGIQINSESVTELEGIIRI